MGKIAFLFSGQGAQYPGMAKEYFDTIPKVASLFQEAEKLRPNTIYQCFDAPKEELMKTENTQPCLYLANLASAIALEERGIVPQALAGFSLGELSALAYGGVYSYLQGFELSAFRGTIMAKENESFQGTMVAVVKLSHEKIEELCKNYQQVYPVNYNTKDQLVVAGALEEIKSFEGDVRTAKGRCIPLAVSGGFHSPFMDNAAVGFKERIESMTFSEPKIKCWSNATGTIYGSDTKSLLAKQINHPVYWQQTIVSMIEDGVDFFIEAGVGNTLTKMVQKISKEVKCFSASKPEDIEIIEKELGRC